MKFDEIIRKTDKGYVLYSKSKGKSGERKRLGGPYKSRAGAEKREKQVQYFKHATESVKEVEYMSKWPFVPGYDSKGKKTKDSVAKNEHKLLDKRTPGIKELADKHGVDTKDIMRELVKGIKVELEHTSDPKVAREIALDHINELPDYYTRLAKVEENLTEEASNILYHGTLKTLSSFKPFTHFGTASAAKDRLEDLDNGSEAFDNKAKIYAVKLNVKNAAKLSRDISDNHTLRDYVIGLIESGSITKEEADTVRTAAQLIKLLRSKNYDGMMYRNRMEDPGSMSYVILDSSQAQIVKTHKLYTKELNKLLRANPSGRRHWNENFADGKVKGKSRPGRVKRAGASCKGSVTDLRAKAKKYGGERGKMYQWCLNMKAGKKK